MKSCIIFEDVNSPPEIEITRKLRVMLALQKHGVSSNAFSLRRVGSIYSSLANVLTKYLYFEKYNLLIGREIIFHVGRSSE